MTIPAPQALQRLRDGNLRFASSVRGQEKLPDQSQRADLAKEAHPIAIILGCADARVAPDTVFDQPLGDLFVVRVAGNVAGPTQVGSVEFAATQFRTRLVIVLGHSGCVAIKTTLDQLQGNTAEPSKAIRSITELIEPAIAPLLVSNHTDLPDSLSHRAVRANVLHSVELLKENDEIKHLIDTDSLVVMGAEYSLETGLVEFFDS